MIYLNHYGCCKEKSYFIKLFVSSGGVSIHMDEGDPFDTPSTWISKSFREDSSSKLYEENKELWHKKVFA